MLSLLSPASEGWGKVIVSVCLSVHSRGYPSPRFFPRSLVPSPFPLGYPSPGWGDWVPHWPGQDGVPPFHPGQNSRANTCYAAGGMALVFTQEDCLVVEEIRKGTMSVSTMKFRDARGKFIFRLSNALHFVCVHGKCQPDRHVCDMNVSPEYFR